MRRSCPDRLADDLKSSDVASFRPPLLHLAVLRIEAPLLSLFGAQDSQNVRNVAYVVNASASDYYRWAEMTV